MGIKPVASVVAKSPVRRSGYAVLPALISWVRWRTSRSRVRSSIARVCCSSVFTATNRMVGRVAASAMAPASVASYFCRFTNHLGTLRCRREGASTPSK